MAQNTVPLYGLQIIPTRAKTVVTINDFPFAQTSHLEDTTSSGRINRFLKRGENVIRIEIDDSVMTQPVDENEAAQYLRVELQRRENLDEQTVPERLFRVERQIDMGDKDEEITMEFLTVSTGEGDREYKGPLAQRSELVVNLETHSIDYSQVPPPAPSVVEIRFTLADFPLLELPWQQGSGTPDAIQLESIQDKVANIYAAYKARNANAVVTHFQNKLQRMSIAQGIPTTELGGYLHESYVQILFTISGLEFSSFSAESVGVESYPNLNLVRAVVDGGAPIRASGDGWEFNLNLYFSQVGGEWVLVE
ncbi:MAG TPA: hypothetical protein VK995_02715 [Oceanipulchritudo sp.]|nr:hypothetical protein [Oceanipulchritudo sp.]